MKTFFIIALRNIVKSKSRSLLLGIAIAAVTTVMVVLSALTSGIQDTILDNAMSLSSGHLNIAGFYKISQTSAAPIVGKRQLLKKIAEENIDTVMPGFTHLQNAQPVLFSHWFLSYCWMLKRDKERLAGCYKRADVMPLGSAAFAGTEFKIDRNFAAKQLGFAEISQNSVDAVSDRDFIIEFLSHCAIISMHLSRLSEDLIIWSSQQFGFIELSEKFTTGSSIMPQKKNPDYAEIVRGKTGRIYGNLIAMITVMKGLPLSYNRDMQEDKEPLFDSAETVKMILDVTSEMISEMKINADKMSAACENGFIMATDVADYLVSKGIPFRTAHGITGKVVNYCIKNKTTFGKLSLNEWRKFCPEFDESVYGVLDAKKAVEKRSSEGGTSLKSVKKQLGKI